ncbi:hypothetical protein [Desulfospira joergensenii]|uniref:hypothetical protein n=1 Tax=Desulfospira joergensenii TaxID=53329 RepID=UPI0003B50A05|nr:hypothetical protein [Desulfospira joergensenii]
MIDEKIPILLFSSRVDSHLKKIKDSLIRLTSGAEIVHCSTIKAFSDGILGMLFGLGIILILIRDNRELEKILQLLQILKDHDIILILDESGVKGMQKSLDLYPRYISYIKDDYTDVFQVMEKMAIKIKRGKKNDG